MAAELNEMEMAEKKAGNYLQFHPREQVPDLPPALLLLEHHTHFSEAELPDEGGHDGAHVVLPLGLLGQRSDVLNGGDDMAAVEVAVPVVVQVADHLLGGPLNPLGGLGLWALVPAEGAEVVGLGLDDAAGVVVGEGLFGVLGPGFGAVGVVAVAERPGVRAHRGQYYDVGEGGFRFRGGRGNFEGGGVGLGTMGGQQWTGAQQGRGVRCQRLHFLFRGKRRHHKNHRRDSTLQTLEGRVEGITIVISVNSLKK